MAPIAARVSRVLGLDSRLAHAVTREVIDALGCSVDTYIERRHAELKQAGLTNDRIFATIRHELGVLRFSAPPLTERQIRRRVYG